MVRSMGRLTQMDVGLMCRQYFKRHELRHETYEVRMYVHMEGTFGPYTSPTRPELGLGNPAERLALGSSVSAHGHCYGPVGSAPGMMPTLQEFLNDLYFYQNLII